MTQYAQLSDLYKEINKAADRIGCDDLIAAKAQGKFTDKEIKTFSRYARDIINLGQRKLLDDEPFAGIFAQRVHFYVTYTMRAALGSNFTGHGLEIKMNVFYNPFAMCYNNGIRSEGTFLLKTDKKGKILKFNANDKNEFHHVAAVILHELEHLIHDHQHEFEFYNKRGLSEITNIACDGAINQVSYIESDKFVSDKIISYANLLKIVGPKAKIKPKDSSMNYFEPVYLAYRNQMNFMRNFKQGMKDGMAQAQQAQGNGQQQNQNTSSQQQSGQNGQQQAANQQQAGQSNNQPQSSQQNGQGQSGSQTNGNQPQNGQQNGQGQSGSQTNGNQPQNGQQNGQGQSGSQMNGNQPQSGQQNGQGQSGSQTNGNQPQAGSQNGQGQSGSQMNGNQPQSGQQNGQGQSGSQMNGNQPQAGSHNGQGQSGSQMNGNQPQSGQQNGQGQSGSQTNGNQPQAGSQNGQGQSGSQMNGNQPQNGQQNGQNQTGSQMNGNQPQTANNQQGKKAPSNIDKNSDAYKAGYELGKSSANPANSHSVWKQSPSDVEGTKGDTTVNADAVNGQLVPAIRDAMQKANTSPESLKERGLISGNMADQLLNGEATLRHQIPISRVITEGAGKLRYGIRKTYHKPSHLQSNRVDIRKGKTKIVNKNLHVFVDCSGSMSEDDINWALAEIALVARRTKTKVTVIPFDSEVYVKAATTISRHGKYNFTPTGRGGTLVQPCFDYLKEIHATSNASNAAIILTDGYVEDHVDTYGLHNVVWILVNSDTDTLAVEDPIGSVGYLSDDGDYKLHKMSQR